ncbi:unnamed protein product [Brugia timori]|uniref:7TM_GPCR_Srx domain-containing protein n=1 Tax=Brugia timori TaxID=42155 RepID=A0A0R3QMB8_9BILA|nr:unnamed protein product [Brugia timori]
MHFIIHIHVRFVMCRLFILFVFLIDTAIFTILISEKRKI